MPRKPRRRRRVSDTPFPGQPGWRTRFNRTGLDPYDTQIEVAYLEGLFVRNLLTGKLRTNHPVSLLFMFAGAMLGLSPALCTAAEVLTGVTPSLMPLAMTSEIGCGMILIPIGIGVALGMNLILSIRDILDAEDQDDEDDEE